MFENIYPSANVCIYIAWEYFPKNVYEYGGFS